MAKAKWLNRNMLPAPYLTLCFSEKEFRDKVADIGDLDHEDFGPWITPHCDATTHSAWSSNVVPVWIACFVCMRPGALLEREKDLPYIVGVLAHEAWHAYCAWHRHRVGGDGRDEEVEAIGVGHITANLYWEYMRRRKLEEKRRAKSRKNK